MSLFKVQRVAPPPQVRARQKNPQVCTIRERLRPAAVVLRCDRMPETIIEIVGFVLVPRRPQQPFERDGKPNLIPCDFLFPFHVLIFVIIFRNIHSTSPPSVLDRTMAFLVCSFITPPPYTIFKRSRKNRGNRNMCYSNVTSYNELSFARYIIEVRNLTKESDTEKRNEAFRNETGICVL